MTEKTRYQLKDINMLARRGFPMSSGKMFLVEIGTECPYSNTLFLFYHLCDLKSLYECTVHIIMSKRRQ